MARVGKAGGVAGGTPGKDESMAEVRLGEDREKMSGRHGDTLRRDALKRADSAVCGRVISCSRGQERWRTKLELCRRESFDDRHWPAALGTAPQRQRSTFPIRFLVEWRGERRSTVAAERRAFGWRGSRSDGCGRSPWGAGEVGSDAETHRARGSSVSADCGRQSHASER